MEREAIRPDESLKFRIERGILVTILALACMGAAASFFVKGMGTNPMLAVAMLLSAPSMALSLYGKRGRLAKLAASVGGALFLYVVVRWLTSLN
ncbi:MAG: hypothetical protein JOY77_12400 [Alphaproteobacteria bacterium]|nr:hypothetical protein [Alphaproteobacteria bacterium]